MADIIANVNKIRYDDIMDDLMDNPNDNTWADFFDLYLKRIRIALGIPGADIIIKTQSVAPTQLIMLRLPNYNNSYDVENGFMGLYIYETTGVITSTLASRSQCNAPFRIGFFYYAENDNENIRLYKYIEPNNLIIYKKNGSYSTFSRNPIGAFYFYTSSSVPSNPESYHAKVYILLEKKSMYEGYRFAFFHNDNTKYDLSTANVLDFLSYYIIMKMKSIKDNDVKTAILGIDSNYLKPSSIRLIKLDDWDIDNTMGSSVSDFTNASIPNDIGLHSDKATKKNELLLKRPFVDGYYNDTMFITGNLTSAYASYDVSKGGNGNLAEYLVINTSGMTEYKGAFKDGVMIDDKEYCGTLTFPSYKYGYPRLLFTKQ